MLSRGLTKLCQEISETTDGEYTVELEYEYVERSVAERLWVRHGKVGFDHTGHFWWRSQLEYAMAAHRYLKGIKMALENWTRPLNG